MTLTPSPVKKAILQSGCSVELLQPQRVDTLTEPLSRLKPRLMVVVAYGQRIPESLYRLANNGCVNLHASLLPRWRGAAPIQRSLLEGDRHTGVSLMQIDSGLDTGPLIAQQEMTIDAHQTAGTLTHILAELAAELLEQYLQPLLNAPLQARPQSSIGVCYAHKITAQDAIIDWNQSAILIERQIRALQPQPGAFCFMGTQRLLIHQASLEATSQQTQALPAGALYCDPKRQTLRVQTGTSVLIIETLQLAGRKRLNARTFIQGQRLRPEAPILLSASAFTES